MPFIPHTPESLITRTDSKNPATTCKGITTTGRPCRRAIGSSPQPSPSGKRKSKNGVVAVLEAEDEDHDGAAAFFCWQHHDQAQELAGVYEDGRTTNVVHLQQRTSIDTLVDRLGVLEIEEVETPSATPRHQQQMRAARKETLPTKWQDVDGPLLAVNGRGQKANQRHPKARPKEQSSLGLFCCIRSVDLDPGPPSRKRNNVEKATRVRQETSKVHPNERHEITTAGATYNHGKAASSRGNRSDVRHARPSLPQERPSQTEDFLSLIPKNLSPQTTSLLLAELAKPISPHDEDGFIYMFWLTDASTDNPEPGNVSSLLDDVPSTPNDRRKSELIQSHARRSGVDSNNATKILLKIGRASNVHRRLNEWTRQCGYDVSMIRYYPYVPSIHQSNVSTPAYPPIAPVKVPHAHKVERLIHLELGLFRIKRDCDKCGKEHREWFGVESTRDGLRKVDTVIKRWVAWSQGLSQR